MNVKVFYYLFIILLAPLLFGHGPIDTLAHETEANNLVIIHIDEDAFVPSEITIELGTEVMFENTGTEVHWPATDNHPSHSLYGGTVLEEHCADSAQITFDSCGPISAGDSWSFTFHREGTFSYHDHLWPHLKGVVTVEAASSSDDGRFFSVLKYVQQAYLNVISFFISPEQEEITQEVVTLNSGNTETEFYESLKSRYESLVVDKNPREAIQSLQLESSEDDEVSALCHDILHDIGRVSYRKYGGFKNAIEFQNDFCNSGYIHGVFESYFESTDQPLAGLAEQCLQYATVNGRAFDLWQCHHGVGHGFMYLTGGDLNESLALCEEGFGERFKSSCQNGAYMEVFNLEVLAKENSYIDPNNPFATCSAQNSAKGDCYLYVPTYLSQTQDMEFSDIFSECDKAEPGYRNTCIRGVGNEAIKRNMNNPDSVFALCKQADSFKDQETCASGIVSMYMNQAGSHTTGVELCKVAPKEFRSVCNKTVDGKEAFF